MRRISVSGVASTSRCQRQSRPPNCAWPSLRPIAGNAVARRVSVTTFAATHPDRGFTVVSDARRKELYWATYDARGHLIDGPNVTFPENVPTGLIVGPAADLYDLAGERVVVPLDPGALVVDPDRLADLGTEPLYLRRPDAQVSTSVKTVLTGRSS